MFPDTWRSSWASPTIVTWLWLSHPEWFGSRTRCQVVLVRLRAAIVIWRLAIIESGKTA